MTSEMKIKESKYNLKKLLQNPEKLSNEYYFEVSNFLSSIKSVFDHLLDDYESKYKLNIPLAIRDLRKEFCKKAKGNVNAERFYHWFTKEYENITKYSEFGFC